MAERWIDWIEPFGPENQSVYMRVPESTAVAVSKTRRLAMANARSRRREEVKKVRAEGHAAALAGKHRQTNPYPTYSMNRGQWWRGYEEGVREIEDNETLEE